MEFSAAITKQNGDSGGGGASSSGANSSSGGGNGIKKRKRDAVEDSKINSASSGQPILNNPPIVNGLSDSIDKKARSGDSSGSGDKAGGVGVGIGAGVGLHCHLDAETLSRLSQLYEGCAGPCLDGKTSPIS